MYIQFIREKKAAQSQKPKPLQKLDADAVLVRLRTKHNGLALLSEDTGRRKKHALVQPVQLRLCACRALQ